MLGIQVAKYDLHVVYDMLPDALNKILSESNTASQNKSRMYFKATKIKNVLIG